MDTEFVKFLATMGVGGVIAGMMFLIYRKDIKQFTEQWQGQSQALMQVVKDNTAAVTANTKTIEALHDRDDEIQRALKALGFEFRRRHRGDEHDNHA